MASESLLWSKSKFNLNSSGLMWGGKRSMALMLVELDDIMEGEREAVAEDRAELIGDSDDQSGSDCLFKVAAALFLLFFRTGILKLEPREKFSAPISSSKSEFSSSILCRSCQVWIVTSGMEVFILGDMAGMLSLLLEGASVVVFLSTASNPKLLSADVVENVLEHPIEIWVLISGVVELLVD